MTHEDNAVYVISLFGFFFLFLFWRESSVQYSSFCFINIFILSFFLAGKWCYRLTYSNKLVYLSLPEYLINPFYAWLRATKQCDGLTQFDILRIRYIPKGALPFWGV